MAKNEWKNYKDEIIELEKLQINLESFKPIEINPELIKPVYTSLHNVADPEKPILATERIYNCVGLLAYDLSKEFAFLAHSYGNEAYGIDNSTSPSQIYGVDGNYLPRGIESGSAIHAIEMLNYLSKKELYQLKIAIIVGSKPNLPLINAMINTIINLRKKRIIIESIELTKPFISGIHTENDINHGKNKKWIDIFLDKKYKETVYNKFTGEIHSYDRTRGSSFAFDVRDGKKFTYNSDTDQYYTYDEGQSLTIKMK